MKEKITDLVTALSKTIKALQLYGINHPSFRNFYALFFDQLADFLNRNHELNFKINRFTMLYGDRIVYREEEKDVSIAFRLFRDGIRSISFTSGMTSEELLRFLEIIAQPSKVQDVALDLWEGDLPHINFYVVEEEDEQLDYKVPDSEVEHINYVEDIKEMINREKINVNDQLSPNLSFDELKTLTTEILNDEERSPLPLAILTLIDFLETEKTQEVIDSLIKLLEQCINIRDFFNARRIVENLQSYPDIKVIEKFENETTILGFRDLANIQENEVFNEFIAFLGFFSKKAIPHFLKVMLSFRRQDQLEALRQNIAYLAQDDVTPIVSFLSSDDTPTLINVVAILGIMKSRQAPSLLQPLIHHLEPLVRIEVISTLKNIGVASMIAQFIDDPNVDVRIKALHALTHVRYPFIYSILLKRVKARDFLDLEYIEQKEYFNCLVANGDPSLVKHLKNILFKWLLLGRRRYRAMRKLAAAALALINTDDAIGILKQGVKKKNRDIKSTCEMALRGK